MVNNFLLRIVHRPLLLASKLILDHGNAVRRQHRQYGHAMAQPPREEQALPRFYEKQYYPVRIGQTFNNRYRVITKLGYGAHSTVWLAHDDKINQYTALKICTYEHSATSPVENELSVLRHLATCSKEHSGAALTRLADDTFEVDGHSCLVLKPYAYSLQQLQDVLAHYDSKVPLELIKIVVIRLLVSINWLQLDCGVVHTEITPQNIMMAVKDDAIFQKAARDEIETPSVPFIDQTQSRPYPIYPSQGLRARLEDTSGDTILTDFSRSRILKGGTSTRGWWMPDTYRAPEVLMSLPWDHGVDIWCIGVMVLELMEGRNLFNPIDRVHSQYVLPLAVAQYIGYMDLPPLWMIQQSSDPVIATFFDSQGRWIADPPIPNLCFEDFVTVIPPGEEKTLFLNFVRKILTWHPTERATTSELMEDEWLIAPFKASGILP